MLGQVESWRAKWKKKGAARRGPLDDAWRVLEAWPASNLGRLARVASTVKLVSNEENSIIDSFLYALCNLLTELEHVVTIW
jgi:hypothetical protein